MKHEAKEKEHGEAKGEPVVGRRTLLFFLTGLLAGGVLGWIIGLSFGNGRLSIAGLAPLVAGGAGVTAFTFASFLGALLGLAGALVGTASEAKPDSSGRKKKDEKSEGKGHQKTSFIQQLPIYGSIALALFMAYTLYEVASRGYGSGTPSDQSNRVTWNQKNAARVGGRTDAETALYILQTVYPASRKENRPGMIVNVAADWRMALAATPLIARPVNAALLISGETDAQESARLRGQSASPAASPIASPLPSPSPSLSTEPAATPSTLAIGVAPENGNVESIVDSDPAAVAAAIDDRRIKATGFTDSNVIIVSGDADYQWALPAGAYSARTGAPILFVTKGGVPQATASALQRRNNHANIFVLGPPEVVAASVFESLKQYGAVSRIEGGDFFENAVRFAEFHDPASGFGWGHTGRGAREYSSVNTILVNSARWQDGLLAAHLAHRGKTGPLLFTEKDRVPAVVDNYLWRQRPSFANTPAEGPFNHVWIVGSFDRISYGTQAWADYSQEIEQYMTLGDSAVSGYEALGIGWIILSIACAFWILFHSTKRLMGVMPIMKAAWVIFALMLGPIAAWLYIMSYHRREKMEKDGMVMWHRPVWLQTVSATVMMFAFDMMLMVLAVFAISYVYGFPIVRFSGPLYWIGSSMFLMMVLMYVIALVVMMLVFHTPMTMHEQKIDSYGKAFMVGLPMMVATMTVESAGMMPTMWWQQMYFLPAMQMPTADDITMWTTLLFSVFIGFLVVLPFNYWMVKKGKKMGMM